jgi:hypothetical protein
MISLSGLRDLVVNYFVFAPIPLCAFMPLCEIFFVAFLRSLCSLAAIPLCVFCAFLRLFPTFHLSLFTFHFSPLPFAALREILFAFIRGLPRRRLCEGGCIRGCELPGC